MVIALFPPLDLKEELDSLTIPVHYLGLRSIFDWRRGLWRLTRLFRRHPPDIVHTHLLYANFYGRLAAILARVPAIVTTLHSVEYSHWSYDRLRFKIRKIIDMAIGRLFNNGFIAVSRAVRDDYIRHCGFKNIVVIHNYLDPGTVQSLPSESIAAVRREFGCGEDAFVLLHVGRLAWEKGQRTLLLAMPEILKAVPRARLVIVGDGPEEESLGAMARSLGLKDVVIFAGRRRDLPPLLGMSDVFLFPSISEGLGIALLEAMAAGLPVVASRVEGIIEVVQHESNGFLVPPDDPSALAAAVIRLSADPDLRRTLGRGARYTVEQQFSVATGLANLEAFYESVVKRRP